MRLMLWSLLQHWLLGSDVRFKYDVPSFFCMQKRGQLTLFIVLGIVLLILIAIMIYYRSSITETVNKNILQKQLTVPADVQKVQDHVQGCVNDMSVIMLYQLGSQGGLLNPSAQNGIVTDNFAIAYGYNAGKSTLPTLVDFRRDFSNFMNSFLPQCLGIADFGKLNVKGTKPSTSVDFLDDRVKVSVDYPIKVSEGETVYTLKDSYDLQYPLRVKLLHDVGDSIVKRTASDPKNIDVSYLLTLGVKVDIYPYDNKTFVYSLEDTQSVYRNASYVYRFAVRY